MVSQNKIIVSQSELISTWQKAQQASWDRKAALARRDFRAANRFSAIKIALAVHVFQQVPATDIEACVQWWRTNFLVSIKYASIALHLPLHCAPLFHLGARELHPHAAASRPRTRMPTTFPLRRWV